MRNIPKKTGLYIGFLITAFIIFTSSVKFIPAGHVGVIYDHGRGVISPTIQPGMRFLIPFWQSVTLFDTRIQEYTMSGTHDEGALQGDDSLDAPTSDGQTVKVEVTLLYKIDSEKAADLYQSVGKDYVEKLIRPIARSQIRMVISRYTAPAIYSQNRQEAETVMTKEITDLLKDKNILVDHVLLRAVNFSPEYSKAIEDKVIAEQRVKQAEYEVLEASQRAQAKIQEAKGLAEAQGLQKQSLTKEYLQLEAINKWDGKLPVSVGGNGTVPFLNLPSNE